MGDGLQVRLGTVKHGWKGHEALIVLHEKTKACVFEDIEIDMSDCAWFDADMCAAFGAILFKLGENLNSIRLTNIAVPVEKILSTTGIFANG